MKKGISNSNVLSDVPIQELLKKAEDKNDIEK